jgi:hypothetical protein
VFRENGAVFEGKVCESIPLERGTPWIGNIDQRESAPENTMSFQNTVLKFYAGKCGRITCEIRNTQKSGRGKNKIRR